MKLNQTYVATRTNGVTQIMVNGTYPLPLHKEVHNYGGGNLHEWGQDTAALHQTALAILVDCLDDQELALRACGYFQAAYLDVLSPQGWTMTSESIAGLVTALLNM